jgi:benzylsuccinate CoA-transferase BbsE subunit
MPTRSSRAVAPQEASERPYAGVRILDMTHTLGSYAGRLFADLGAEVIRIEPPGGLPDRKRVVPGAPSEARFAFFNASKKSIEIDFASEAGRGRFKGLARSAQIIFLERGGPFYDRIGDVRATAPSTVITVVSPFGATGPLSDAPASDLILQAAGGIAWMSGRLEDAPLSLPFDQATMLTSIYAATVSAIALVDSEATGHGHLIDVSAQECVAHSLQNAIQVWDLERRISVRGGEGTRDATEDIFPCRDGYVFLAAPPALPGSFRALVCYMRDLGHPSADHLSEERWQNREWRLTREARDAFRAILTDFTMGLDRETLTKEAIARRIVLGPVSRVSEIFTDEQLVHRGFFTPMKTGGREIAFPGAPYRMTPPLWAVAPAPELGEQSGEIAEAAQ